MHKGILRAVCARGILLRAVTVGGNSTSVSNISSQFTCLWVVNEDLSTGTLCVTLENSPSPAVSPYCTSHLPGQLAVDVAGCGLLLLQLLSEQLVAALQQLLPLRLPAHVLREGLGSTERTGRVSHQRTAVTRQPRVSPLTETSGGER